MHFDSLLPHGYTTIDFEKKGGAHVHEALHHDLYPIADKEVLFVPVRRRICRV